MAQTRGDDWLRHEGLFAGVGGWQPLILRVGVLRRDRKSPGLIWLQLFVGRGEDHSMSCPTKSISLNSHLSVFLKPAKARAKPVGSKFEFSQLDGEQPSHGFRRRNVPPVLKSLACCLDKPALNLVPIAYLIPVIVAATQWGIWPATVASGVGAGRRTSFSSPTLQLRGRRSARRRYLLG